MVSLLFLNDENQSSPFLVTISPLNKILIKDKFFIITQETMILINYRKLGHADYFNNGENLSTRLNLYIGMFISFRTP